MITALAHAQEPQSPSNESERDPQTSVQEVSPVEPIEDSIGDESPALTPTEGPSSKAFQEQPLTEPQEKVPAVPSVVHGKKLYQEYCAICHGVNGDAQTTLAQSLSTPPRSFYDPKVHETLTPATAFEAMTTGRKDSGMPAFTHLTPHQRWCIAAYLFTLRSDLTPTEDPRPELSWEESKHMSDMEIINMFRKRGVPENEIMTQLSLIRKYPQ